MISQRDFPRAAGQERRLQETQLSPTASQQLTQPDLISPPSPSPPKRGFHPAIHISPLLKHVSGISKEDVPNSDKYSFKNAGCHMERVLLALAQDHRIINVGKDLQDQ